MDNDLPDDITFKQAQSLPLCERCHQPTDVLVQVDLPTAPQGITQFFPRSLCMPCVIALRMWYYDRTTSTKDGN